MSCRILQIPEMKGALAMNEKNFALKMVRKDKKVKQKNEKKAYEDVLQIDE